MNSAWLDPELDLLTIDFDDVETGPDAIEDALATLGFVVDRVPLWWQPSKR